MEREETISDLESPSGSPPAAEEPFSEAEVQAFIQKLETWGQGLSERDRMILARVLRNTETGADDEVGGYLFRLISPVATNLKLSNHLQVSAQDVTVNKAKTADKAFAAMDAYIRG